MSGLYVATLDIRRPLPFFREAPNEPWNPLSARPLDVVSRIEGGRRAAEEAPNFVADSGLYSAENVAHLTAADVRWISRVPDTSKQARTALSVPDEAWQQAGDLYWAPDRPAPTGERWVVGDRTDPRALSRASQ